MNNLIPKCDKCGKFISIKKPHKVKRIYEQFSPLADLVYHVSCYFKKYNK